MPQCAQIADQLNIVRCMKTTQSEHLQGDQSSAARQSGSRGLHATRRWARSFRRRWGSLTRQFPNFILLDPIPGGNEFEEFKASNWAGWLGPEHAPVRLGGDYTQLRRAAATHPSRRPGVTRETLRRFFASEIRKRPLQPQSRAARTRPLSGVKGLMASADLFDVNKLPAKDRERYGPGSFGQHALMARHLVEHGAPFVMVANGMNWDNHVFQHEIHQMLVPELDRVLFHLITDLEERGLLDPRWSSRWANLGARRG